ncbi:Rho GTPase-activating protein 7 [Tupaia chinensis]|uniref:Rho GTPase-activating protein 7 n=1 Tax=Tupaia chinensis TaxID=246437 RepID=L9L115_TUPCH|nr:Rho GTPase-activating protein 7 [Tupaia chinensis]
MSAAVRKRSWEEHVSRRLGEPFPSDDANPACHHGLLADSLQASMEKDEALNVDRKEKCVSLPDCCHGPEPGDFPGRPMGHVSKDENDSQEGEDPLCSLEASTETLVHVSDEDVDSDLYLTVDKQILTPHGHQTSGQHNTAGAGSFVKTLPVLGSNQGPYKSWGMAADADFALLDTSGESKVGDATRKSLELCDDGSLREIKGAPEGSTFGSLHEKDSVPETQLLNSAVIAQQRRKLDFPKDEPERNTCRAAPAEVAAGPLTEGGWPLLEADFESCFLQPPSCSGGMLDENGLQKSGFSEHQNRSPPEVNTGDGMQCLHAQEPPATQEPADNQVRLRKRKEIREDRDRPRLDSMVLLIMKLDQLDQDIENALSSGSSPSSTPTNLRRHGPDLESGSESGPDAISVNQKKASVSSNTASTDLSPSIPGASSGTKPKAAVSSKC